MVIHRTPWGTYTPQFVPNFHWFLDVILPGGMSRCRLFQTGDRRPISYETCSFLMEKMEDFWSTKKSENFIRFVGHFSHSANSHSTLWRPKNPHSPCYWTPSEWFPSNLDWLTRHLLVSRRFSVWCSRWLHICWISWRFVYVIWFGDQGVDVRIFPWGQHWQPEMDCPLITVERFTNGLFLVHFWVF